MRFVNEIENAYRKCNLSQFRHIEITDTSLLRTAWSLKTQPSEKIRISIRLDNFGSENSSLAHLRFLPLDGISIGQAYIRDINTDAAARAIVTNLIALAESLKLEVIAEGVENEKQIRFLLENGCRIVQGYLISKPLPRQDAMKFITGFRPVLAIGERMFLAWLKKQFWLRFNRQQLPWPPSFPGIRRDRRKFGKKILIITAMSRRQSIPKHPYLSRW